MKLDWPFLWSFTFLTGVVVAPVRYLATSSVPPAGVWAVGTVAVVACFVLADRLDAGWIERIGGRPEGSGTTVAIQFLVVPAIALAVAPPVDAPWWLAVIPGYDPLLARPVWVLAAVVGIPIAIWLGVFDGLGRLGLAIEATWVFVITWGALSVLGGLSLTLVGPIPDGLVWPGILGLGVLAGVIGYGPAPSPQKVG